MQDRLDGELMDSYANRDQTVKDQIEALKLEKQELELKT